jgi:transposase-like protein
MSQHFNISQLDDNGREDIRARDFDLETRSRKSTPYNTSEACPNCDSENVKFVGGVTGDYYVGGRAVAVDVSNYLCLDCGEQYSD